MSTQTKSPSQGLLFSEPAYSETGVWCELNPGIDPSEWAGLCRKIGNMGAGVGCVRDENSVAPGRKWWYSGGERRADRI